MTDWRGKLLGNESYLKRSLSAIRYLVIHHSAANVDSTALSIADYHVNKLGWPGIGYHYLVHWDGAIDYVGDIETIRANVAMRNHEVVGICLTGDFTSRIPTPDQIAATRQLLADLLKQLPGRQVVGHKDVALANSPTACPGALWDTWKGELV